MKFFDDLAEGEARKLREQRQHDNEELDEFR